MSTPVRTGFDVEAILSDLYASEINASISWIWDGNFYVVLGNPKLAEGWALPTIRDAVLWLRAMLAPITQTASSPENTAASSDPRKRREGELLFFGRVKHHKRSYVVSIDRASRLAALAPEFGDFAPNRAMRTSDRRGGE
jgi:hypothetical protein